MNSIDVRPLIHLFGQEIYLVINKLLVENWAVSRLSGVASKSNDAEKQNFFRAGRMVSVDLLVTDARTHRQTTVRLV